MFTTEQTSRSLFTRRPMGRDADLFARCAGTRCGRYGVHLRGCSAGTCMLHFAGSGRANARRPTRARAAPAAPAAGSVSSTLGDVEDHALMDFGGDQVAVVHAGLPRLELGLRLAANGLLPSGCWSRDARKLRDVGNLLHRDDTAHTVLHNFREPGMSTASLVPVAALARPAWRPRL